MLGESHLIKKGFAVGMLLLVVISISFPSNGMIVKPRMLSKTCFDKILYVGGNGPNNYSKIQDAITNSTDGDIVFVYNDSSPYVEHIIIDRSIHLLGENKTTTVIDGEGIGDVVLLLADNISVSGFTIQHSGDIPKIDAGIESRSKNNVIFDNVILQNGQYAVGILLNESSDALVENNVITENGNEGVFLEKSTGCVIRENVITENGHCAIVISRSSKNIVVENVMYANYATVSLWPGSTENEIAWNIMRHQEYSGVGIWQGADKNSIHHNYLSNNSLYGFIITRAQGNIIANNTIWGSNEGMHLIMANKTIIKFNNFIDNNISANFENSSCNRWRQNYWDDHQGRWPKGIKGMMRLPWNKTIVVPWINIDWFPALEAYDNPLSGGGG